MRKDVFPSTDFSGDIYVGDYTEYAKTHPSKSNIGVMFCNQPFPDINSLYIINRRHISVKAVNFEKCRSLLLDEKGNSVKQCEGLCFANNAKRNGWVLLIELKYCQGKNVGYNVDSAKGQLEKSLIYLREEKGIVSKRDKVYWVISIPDHGDMEPFESFVFSQNDLLDVKEKFGVIAFFRQNKIEIHTDSILKIPK